MKGSGAVQKRGAAHRAKIILSQVNGAAGCMAGQKALVRSWATSTDSGMVNTATPRGRSVNRSIN